MLVEYSQNQIVVDHVRGIVFYLRGLDNPQELKTWHRQLYFSKLVQTDTKSGFDAYKNWLKEYNEGALQAISYYFVAEQNPSEILEIIKQAGD